MAKTLTLLASLLLCTQAHADPLPATPWSAFTRTHVAIANDVIWLDLYSQPISVGVIDGNMVLVDDFVLEFPAASTMQTISYRGTSFDVTLSTEPFSIPFTGYDRCLCGPNYIPNGPFPEGVQPWLGIDEYIGISQSRGRTPATWTITGPTEQASGNFITNSGVSAFDAINVELSDNNEILAWWPRTIWFDALQSQETWFWLRAEVDGQSLIVSASDVPEPGTLCLLVFGLPFFVRRNCFN